MSLREQVQAALDCDPLSARDAATAGLALEYARLYDAAAPAAKYADALEWLAGQGTEDRDSDKHIRTITVALAAHSVASDLGPKLLACLEALGMSPRARNQVRTVVDDKPAVSPLDALAERRRARAAAPVHPTGTGPV